MNSVMIRGFLRGLRGLLLLFTPLLVLGALTFLFIQTAMNTPEALPQPVKDFARWAYSSTQGQHDLTPAAASPVGGIVMTIGLGLFLVALYFLPTIVGHKRRNAAAIFLLNLLLGWTLLGWVIALVWAAIPDQPSSSSTNTTSSPAPIP